MSDHDEEEECRACALPLSGCETAHPVGCRLHHWAHAKCLRKQFLHNRKCMSCNSRFSRILVKSTDGVEIVESRRMIKEKMLTQCFQCLEDIGDNPTTCTDCQLKWHSQCLTAMHQEINNPYRCTRCSTALRRGNNFFIEFPHPANQLFDDWMRRRGFQIPNEPVDIPRMGAEMRRELDEIIIRMGVPQPDLRNQMEIIIAGMERMVQGGFGGEINAQVLPEEPPADENQGAVLDEAEAVGEHELGDEEQEHQNA